MTMSDAQHFHETCEQRLNSTQLKFIETRFPDG